MAAPSFWEDGRRAQGLVQERSDLARAVGRFEELDREVEDLRTLWEMASEAGDESIGPEIAQQAAGLRDALAAFEIKVVLSGPHDGKNAILSIHPGAGGTESQDWAQMLMRMYLRWVEREGFKAEVVDLLPGEEAGIKSATITVTGEYAYGYLRGETGVHRLIRISPFDASKRRHTSFASVAVIPEVEDVEVVVKDDDLRIDVYRSSGPGGQGVNTADSAVRITHLPSGIVVACQNERSQLRNRDTAMRILRARLFQIYERKQREELAELTGEKKDIAFGSQIRTYTFHPYQIIKDHRTGVEVGNVAGVMDGDLAPFIRAFLTPVRPGQDRAGQDRTSPERTG
jgi:peptide chain release factor 2